MTMGTTTMIMNITITAITTMTTTRRRSERA
jgi:hypothetical protein